ncbi:hypothetical protein JW865_01055, partial [Candidatus Bathyarchaeota archaeon]|nr:hypothetical protein [Candidatus Bathyarchaeota archaeon]
FIEKKYGARIFGLLSLILWLVGGGFAPIFMALFGFGAASKINSSLNWWRRNLPITLVHFLSKLWHGLLIVYVLVFVFGVEIAVFGYPLLWIFNANVTYTIQWGLAIIMLILLPIPIITAFAHDIIKKE